MPFLYLFCDLEFLHLAQSLATDQYCIATILANAFCRLRHMISFYRRSKSSIYEGLACSAVFLNLLLRNICDRSQSKCRCHLDDLCLLRKTHLDKCVQYPPATIVLQ